MRGRERSGLRSNPDPSEKRGGRPDEKAEERIREQVASANRGLEKNLDKTMTVAGFRRKGSNYEREAIVDSTMWATETEKQRIGVYEYFEAPSFDYGVDLSGAAIKDSNTRILEAKVEKAKKRLDAYLGMLFGSEEEGEEGLDLDEGFLKLVEEVEASIRGSAQAEKGKETKGLFNIHVGYVPVMDKNKPEKVKEAGYGELGRIYEQFFIDEARFGRGIAVSGAPWYSQKLWDDDADNDGKSDGLLGAPTVKTIADIGMAVAASLVVPGGGVGLLMSVGLNLVDDALFTMADVSNGVDAGDAWGSFAKKGLTSVASAGINMGSGVLDGVIGSTGMMEVGSDVMLAGAQSAANTYSSAFINSLDFDNFGNSGWIDGGSFAHATSWGTSGSGYLSSMGGALVSSGLENSWSGALNTFGFDIATSLDYKAMAGFSSLTGSLVGNAIEYGMTGSTTLNVAKVMGTGALELHVGGEGPLLELGRDGTDVSYGRLSQAYTGFTESQRRGRIQSEIKSAADGRSMMAAINDAVIGRSEIGFSGETEVATQLSSQLEHFRKVKSNRNLHELFGNTAFRSLMTEKYGEGYLDENLMLAVEQADIRQDEFMDLDYFDTNGSFALAHSLYESGEVGLERMFSSEKAYAGKVRNAEAQEVMIGQKQSLLNEYYVDDIADAAALLGGDYFDAQDHMTERIASNKMRLVGNEMMAIGKLHRDHRALVEKVEEYDKKGLSDGREFEMLKGNMYASAENVYAMMQADGDNPFATTFPSQDARYMNAAGTASSPIYGSNLVTTLYGIDFPSPAVAAATGRVFGKVRNHFAWDVAGGTFVSPETGELDIAWSPGGTGISSVITGDEYRHKLEHGFTGSIDQVVKLLLAKGDRRVSTGTVVGFYEKYETNKSTGPHTHWIVEKNDGVNLTTGEIDWSSIDNKEWVETNWGESYSSIFSIDDDALLFSGKPLGEYGMEEVRNLYKEERPSLYWPWKGLNDFGISTDSQAEYNWLEHKLEWLM